MALTPRILYQEAGLVVVDKPAGLPSTGRTLDDTDCVQGWLMVTLRRRRVWAVHQLDRDTTGLNLFVLRKNLVHRYSQQLKAGTKTYLALVQGALAGRHTITAPIGRRQQGRLWLPALGGERPKPARSSVEALRSGERASLVAVRIATGRTHQVRLHLLHLGHPLLGEHQHISPPDTSAPRCMLHAWRLELPSGSFDAPIPADLALAAARAGVPYSTRSVATTAR